MYKQIESDAWILGYEWAMGNVYIGDNSIQYTHLQIMPEYEEGIEAALNVLKRQQLVELVMGESDDDVYQE